MMFTGERVSPRFTKEYPRRYYQLDVREFNLVIAGRNFRFIGLFVRERKYKKQSGHWGLVRDGKGKLMMERMYA